MKFIKNRISLVSKVLFIILLCFVFIELILPKIIESFKASPALQSCLIARSSDVIVIGTGMDQESHRGQRGETFTSTNVHVEQVFKGTTTSSIIIDSDILKFHQVG